MAGSGEGVKACDVVPYVGQPGVCRRCGSKLPGRCTAWCSSACEREWQINHYWTMARPAAVKRDGGKCVRCGGVGRKLWRRRAYLGHRWAMKQIGIEVEFVAETHYDRSKLYYTDVRITSWVPWLEVNHIEPREGRGYQSGCHHHLTNLETLCHDCHVAETTRQGRERRARNKMADGLFSEAAQ